MGHLVRYMILSFLDLASSNERVPIVVFSHFPTRPSPASTAT